MNRKLKIALIVVGAIWLITEIVPFGLSLYRYDMQFQTDADVKSRAMSYNSRWNGDTDYQAARVTDDLDLNFEKVFDLYWESPTGQKVLFSVDQTEIGPMRYFPFYKSVSFSRTVRYSFDEVIDLPPKRVEFDLNGEIQINGHFTGYGLISGRQVANIIEASTDEKIGETISQAVYNQVQDQLD